MADQFPAALRSLIHELSRLPTIGHKSAQRLALHLLKTNPEQAQQLAHALENLHSGVHFCKRCFFLAEGDLCSICLDPRRDPTAICVVEEPTDVIAFEKSGAFRGRYHVLLGRLSPLHGIMPENLKIQELMARLEGDEHEVRELILAMNPSVDGDATALYLQKLLAGKDIKVTRLGVGMPMGGTLEYADELTLQKAFEARR